MTSPEPMTSVDFTAPRRLAGTANRALSSWNSTVISVLQEYWQALAGSRITLHPARIDSSLAQKAQQALPDPGYAALLKVGDSRFDAMVAFSGRVVQALVSEMLGTLGTEWPDARDLTAAELSLLELLFGEIARAMGQGWPEVEPLPVEFAEVLIRPLRSRIFQPRDNLVRVVCEIRTAVGSDTFVILMPQSGLESIGINETSPAAATEPSASPRMKVLAESLPVTMTVSLGRALLTLGEMNQLTVGDTLVLDQSPYAPLEAKISGQMQWLGFPCRLGQRQGFRIVASGNE